MDAGDRDDQILGHLLLSFAGYAGICVYYMHFRILYKYFISNYCAKYEYPPSKNKRAVNVGSSKSDVKTLDPNIISVFQDL